MIKIKSFKNLFPLTAVLFFSFLLILNPKVCKEGIVNAIMLCGQVLIPALFPFSFCVLFIMNSGGLKYIKILSPITNKLLKLSTDLFAIFILSMLGGYPIGAKLIDEQVKEKRLSEKEGRTMLNYCINAGPAFIVSAVGSGILGDKKTGVLLLISHITASILICLLCNFFFTKKLTSSDFKRKEIPFADNFVLSASEAASVTINICTFVILFCAINSYLQFYSACLPFLEYLLYITEITFAVTKTRNIYLISFLLGFGGLCIWGQIISCAKNMKINFPLFIVFRLSHGGLSMLLTKVLLMIFPISAETFSNGKVYNSAVSVSNGSLSAALALMGIIFVISLSRSQKNTKILEEFI